MEISLLSDAASVATSQGLGFSIRPSLSTTNHQISVSAAMFAVDALASPPVKSNSHSTNAASRTLRRRKRRTRRRSLSGDGDGDAGGYGSVGDWFFGGEGPIFGGGDGGGGGFGGGGGGGGKGWNFGGFGGQNWDSSSSPADPAFDFVYEVVSWIVLSNCVHFAFKKVLRAVAGDAGREKVVPIRLTSVC